MEVWSQFAKESLVNGMDLEQNLVTKASQLNCQSFLCLKHTKIGRLNAPPLLTEYKSIHLYPTTGCDAATRYSMVEIRVGGTNTGLAAFAYESSGCYVAVWQKKDKLLELEYCLVSPQDFQSRIRIIIQLLNVVDNSIANMTMRSIRIFFEHWYGPLRDGDQIEACATRNSAFASTAPVIQSFTELSNI